VEEMVDAFNYFFSLLVLTGVSAEELYEMYCHKDKIIHKRLKDDY
jgi:dimeric dUTPase (all-alpha-NTP-PPase superfamily)